MKSDKISKLPLYLIIAGVIFAMINPVQKYDGVTSEIIKSNQNPVKELKLNEAQMSFVKNNPKCWQPTIGMWLRSPTCDNFPSQCKKEEITKDNKTILSFCEFQN